MRNPPPLLSVISIIASMSCSAVGSGIIFVYVPFALNAGGFPTWIAGSMVSSIAAGGLIGCLIAGPLIRRVGHARIFSCFAAIIILSFWVIAVTESPVAWLLARALYGVASNAVFVVAQSWLNHAAENQWRGRAMSLFYLGYVLGLGCGSFLFGFIPADTNLAPVFAMAFTTLAILPVGLTRLPAPPPPEKVTIDFAMVWRISPVGMMGILASGALSMIVQGFTPIYATGNGLGQKDVALLLFLMQFGMLGVQFPLGALSDRMDRRIVMIIACLIVAALAAAASIAGLASFFLLALIFAIWSGSTETIYSLANAHANDRSDPADFVVVASTMLVAWSAAAFVAPAAVTALTPYLGDTTFMYAAIAIALPYALFVLHRLRQRTRPADTGDFAMRTAQFPDVAALVSPDDAGGLAAPAKAGG